MIYYVMRKEKDTISMGVRVLQFIFALLMITMICFSFVGCGTIKEIPVQTIEKVIVRDSLIYVTDSIIVEVPKEVVKEVLPQLDTSILQTSVAKAVAYLDTTKRQIHHTLEQKGAIKTRIDTVFQVQYIDRIVEKDVPIEVEVIKYKRDGLFWYLLIFQIVVILILAVRVYLKFKI